MHAARPITAPWSDEDLSRALLDLAAGKALRGPVPSALRPGLEAIAGALDQRDRRLTEVAAAAAAAQEASDQANEAKSAFLAHMSHELRTPLNAIIGYAELIHDEHDDDELRGDVERILTSGRHLLGLVGDILDLARVEAGRFEIELSMVDLGELVTDVAEGMRPVVEQRNNRLTVCNDAAPVLLTDATKVRQVLINLLSNAAKFTEGGEVGLRLSQTPWEVAVAVHDTGPGIAEERQRAIFEPFTQEDRDTHLRHGGTGLGLAITRRFCHLLGGDIRLRSAPGEGSTFTMVLPRPPELG